MVLVTAPVHAGRLRDFEKAATKQNTTSTSDQNTDGDDHCSGFWGCLLSTLFDNSSSSSDTTDSTDPYDPGVADDVGTPDRRTPTLGSEADVAYQSLGTGLRAYDLDLSAKLGLFNVNGRATHFVETNPAATLDVYQANLVYPVRLGTSTTLGLGVGLYRLAGIGINTGFSFTLPLVYRVSDSGLRLSVTPVQAYINGNRITDVDVRTTYQLQHLNLFVGYREMQAGSQVLNGPYVGAGYSFD